MLYRFGLFLGALAIASSGLAFRPLPTPAVPLFSRQYDVTCAKCHSVIPHLNEFGAAFLASGDRVPGVQPGPAFPLAGKANLVDSSANQGDGPDGAGLPKAIVDEIELFTSGTIGSRAIYYFEQYLVDGGQLGSTRDAWISDRVNPWQARIPLFVQAGSFTLPLPVDPETFRDSYQGYTLYEQRVGANPFNFFNPKIGGRMSVGNPLCGVNVQLFAGSGHDRQSGLATSGTDTMVTAQESAGRLTLAAYRYDGTRPLTTGRDRFARTGFGLVYDGWGRLSSETVLQTGWDSSCGIAGLAGCASSGGFSQLRYAWSRRWFALTRYEGTQDPTNGFARDTVALLGYAPAENARVTLEDVITHAPSAQHTLNLQLTVAY